MEELQLAISSLTKKFL